MDKNGFSKWIKPKANSDPPTPLSSQSGPRPRASPASSPSKMPPAPITNQNQPNPRILGPENDQKHRDYTRSLEKRRRLQDRISSVLAEAACEETELDNVKLVVVGRSGLGISMIMHRRILADRSKFFAEKFRKDGHSSQRIEFRDCDDVEAHVEALLWMYSAETKTRLMGEEVCNVLSLLKVCVEISFDVGVTSCLEYLESIPWTEEEEEKVIDTLCQCNLLQNSTPDVLQRLSNETSESKPDDIFLKVMYGVFKGRDDRARKEMKSSISHLLREENGDQQKRFTISKDAIFGICHFCLSSLILILSEATSIDEKGRDRGLLMTEIARESDNMQWVLDILIDQKMGNEFVELWADQKELAILHSKIPVIYRHEISKITAQICIAIGKGRVLVPKITRFSVLTTWLEALYNDFSWMKGASRGVDRKVVEDGLSKTILTLPLSQQESILLDWMVRFLAKGDDCPNIHRAFEVWWRRSFFNKYESDDGSSHVQMTVYEYPE